MKNLKTYASIDTIEIMTTTYIEPNKFDFITHDSSRRITTDSDEQKYKYRINPDKNTGFDTSCYDGYKVCIDNIYAKTKFDSPVKTRIDFRFDNYDVEYEDCYKINKLLILLIANQYKVKNTYQSTDMFNNKVKTLRIQNKRFEIEFYDKSAEEPDSLIKTRLELRSKALYDNTGEELDHLRTWTTRLKKVCDAEEMDKLTAKLNDNLIERYAELKAKQQVTNASEFVTKYSDSIFTRRQLIDLYKALGVKSAEVMATKYQKTHQIEFFRVAKLTAYVDGILNSAMLFAGAELMAA